MRLVIDNQVELVAEGPAMIPNHADSSRNQVESLAELTIILVNFSARL